MTHEIADLIRVWARRKAIAGQAATINLYGGEPFLNWQIVQYLGVITPAIVSIFTNGATALPDQIDWCRTNEIVPRRSTAGCPEAAAITRPGDYTQKWLAEASTHRLVVIPETARHLRRSVSWLHQEGYYGPVDVATDNYVRWGRSEAGIFDNEFRQLAREFVEQYKRGNILGIENFANFGRAIYGQAGRMVLGCGAGWNTWGVTWDGRIVACHRCFREPPESALSGGRLCDILSGNRPSFGPDLVDQVAGWATAREGSKCLKCQARQCCPRGCLHSSKVVAGKLGAHVVAWCRFTRMYARLARWINGELPGERWWEKSPTPCDGLFE
jgi:radical SAM protein with 4Fe4S-binding SPASM domain